MADFDALPDSDRWALSFYVGSLAFPESSQSQGRQMWEKDARVRAAIPDLATLVGNTPADIARELGDGKAGPLTSYLRRQPEAVVAKPAGSLMLSRQRRSEEHTLNSSP